MVECFTNEMCHAEKRMNQQKGAKLLLCTMYLVFLLIYTKLQPCDPYTV